jgi:(2Fe-2S) ferredoxin
MKRTHTSTPTDQEASGPLVAVCAGHRCSALHRLVTGQDGADRLRSTIKTGTGGVLVSTECLGACARGAVAAVARRDGNTGVTGPSVWLGGMDQPAALDALLSWLASGGPARIDKPAESVPPVLHRTILGIGAPISAHNPQR